MERKYYEINEKMARTAKEMMSFNEYVHGSKTKEYKKLVDETYDLAEKVIKEKPDCEERINTLAERFSRKMAENFNSESRIECMCPSVMIAGPSNFPVKKKEKQNEARRKNYEEYTYILGIRDRINNILYGSEIIKSGDKDAVEKLEKKIESLKEDQEFMKSVNTYYAANKTLEGCPNLTPKDKEDIQDSISRKIICKPFESYTLRNNNQNIKFAEDRLNRLIEAKERGTTETVEEYFRVVENTEIMRLQLFFDDKPSEDIRNILKSNGFKWAPSKSAWQRQLTNNARYSLIRVKNELKKIKEVIL